MREAKKLDQTLRDILIKWHPDPDSAIWDCHGTWVVYHKAVEVMAAKAGIAFALPQFVAVDMAGKTVVILVSASLGEKTDWATGEVSPANNKNSYPVAMAEKRARDRVAIKLLGLHGVYSEDEADDFKAREEPQRQEPPTERKPSEPMASDEQIFSIGDELKRTGRSPTRLLKHYGVKEPKYLTQAQAVDALAILKAAPDTSDEVAKAPAEATA